MAKPEGTDAEAEDAAALLRQKQREEMAAAARRMKPRQYQVELLQEARKRNVIAFLDTGAGKTLISVLLIRERSADIGGGETKRNTVFLAPKVSLVQQQADVLSMHLDLKVCAYYGDMGVDFWDQATWIEQLDRYDVLCMTPQILLNILRHGFITLSRINLLVLDECHHALKKNPYNCIMQEFYHHKAVEGVRPHVFGMTASPVNMKATQSASNVQSVFATLESNLDAKVLTVSNRDEMEAIAPSPDVLVREYPPPTPNATIARAVERMTEIWRRLRVAADAAQRVWQAEQLAMANLTNTGMAFDDERHRTAAGSMARDVGGIMHILQEMGPYAAAAAALQVLRPAAKNIYQERQAALIASQAKFVFRGAAADDDGSDSDAPAGVEPGKDVETLGIKVEPAPVVVIPAGFTSTGRLLLGHHTEEQPEEKAAVVQACAGVVRLMADLLLAPGVHKDALLEGLPEDLTEIDVRNKLHDTLEGILNAVPAPLVDAQLIGRPEPASQEWQVATGCPMFTPKVQTTAMELLKYKEASELSRKKGGRLGHWSCILFVTRKMTSLAMHALLQAAPSLNCFVTSAPFMGYGGHVNAASLDSQAQADTLRKFKAGDLNVLVSTSVAEEGLDLKQCQLVLRFDLPPTMLAFIQSRGRARVVGSHLVLMLEAGNICDKDLVDNVQRYEAEMRVEAARRMQSLQDGESDEEDEFALLSLMPDAEREFRVESTGAKVTIGSAKQTIYYFTSKLPSDKYTELRPRFSTTQVDGAFQTTVVLPNNSPVRMVQGQPQRRRPLAVASACLEAIKELYKAGGLNNHLLPEFKTELSEDEDESHATEATRVGGDLPTSVTVTLRSNIPKVLLPVALEATEAPAQRLLHLYSFNLTYGKAGGSQTQHAFGLLVQQHLPALPSFQMPTQGLPEARVDIAYVGPRQYSQAQLGAFQAFHKATAAPAYSGEAQLGGYSADYTPDDQWAASSHGAWYICVPIHPASSKPMPASTCATSAPADATTAAPALTPASPTTPSFRDYWEQGTGAFEIDDASVARAAKGYQPLTNDAGEVFATAQLAAMLPNSVIVTTYNRWVYFYEGIREDLTPDSPFPKTDELVDTVKAAKAVKAATAGADPAAAPMSPRAAKRAAKRKAEAAAAAEAAAKAGTAGTANQAAKAGTADTAEPSGDTAAAATGTATGTAGAAAAPAGHAQPAQPAGEPTAGSKRKDPEPDGAEPTTAAAAGDSTGAAEGHGAGSSSGQDSAKVEEPTAAQLKAAHAADTFRNYYKNRWQIKELRADQPLIQSRVEWDGTNDEVAAAECQSVPTKKHKQAGKDAVMLIPELCRLHPLSKTAYLAAKILPTAMWWLKSLLLASELRDTIVPAGKHGYRAPDPLLILEALTPKMCQQKFSYELWETLGDGFLKYAACLHLFTAYPNAHEGQLTLRKDRYISNATLGKVGQQLGLEGYIAMPLLPSNWAAPGLETVQPKQECEMRIKVLADSVEALIGIFYYAGGEAAATALLRAIGVLPKETRHAANNVISACTGRPGLREQATHLVPDPDQVVGSPAAPPQAPANEEDVEMVPYRADDDALAAGPLPFQHQATPAAPAANGQPAGRGHGAAGDAPASPKPLKGAEKVLGYRFRRPELMLEACTHCSWPDLEPQCYQRLEFLGDAVLDFCITRHYILTYRDLQPGKMHDIRSASVNNGRLACIAAVSGLHRHLRHCSPSLFAQVSLFLQEVAHTVKQHAGEEASAAGLEKVGDEARHMAYQWATQASFSSTTTAPKVLADLLESVTGAVYEDTGRDLEATWKVVQKLVQPMVTPTNCPMHPVRELQERCQFLGLELVYQTEYGQPGDVTMTALIQGIPAGRHEGGPNKRTSMKFAAEDALEHWMERVEGKVGRLLPSLETAPNSCMMTHK